MVFDVRAHVCRTSPHCATEGGSTDLPDPMNERVRRLEPGRDGPKEHHLIGTEAGPEGDRWCRKVRSRYTVMAQDGIQGWQSSVADKPLRKGILGSCVFDRMALV